MSFAKDILRLEAKKLILPILAILVLSFFVSGLYDYRSDGHGEKIAEITGQSQFNYTVIRTEHTLFNKSLNSSEKKRIQQKNEKARRKLDKLSVNTNFVILGKYIYGLNLVALLPGEMNILGLPESIGLYKRQGALYNYYSDYKVSEDAYFKLLRWNIKGMKLNELGIKVNNSRSNWSIKEFRKEVRMIRNQEIPEEKIFNGEQSRELSSSFSYNLDEVKEVKIQHFIPAYIATFIIYYLLSGFILGIIRYNRNKENLDSEIKKSTV